MPLICHSCRDDINEQQRLGQAEQEKIGANTLAIAQLQNKANAYLLNHYDPLSLESDEAESKPIEEKDDNGVNNAHDDAFIDHMELSG